jgi:AGZA family xanthine/uracil permease-like MFS transporter
METQRFSVPYFVKGDFDGFIGLFIDNLINLLIITGLCLSINMSPNLVFSQILPATALSVLAGNLFYSWLARRLALRERRADVTALPYGINTVSLLAYFSLIMTPVYLQTKDPVLAWQVGVMACFVSALFEGIGAFIGDYLRRITPRASLLSTLAGIAIAFIALDQTIRIWDRPLVAFIPLALIMADYFSRVHLPFRIPAGLYALVAGGAIAWTTGGMDPVALRSSVEQVSFRFPGFILFDIFSADNISRMVPYLAVAVPMGLMSFFGALQNLESAEAAGDTFPARPVMLMNGIGTMVGAFCGSAFPTHSLHRPSGLEGPGSAHGIFRTERGW